MCEERRGGWGGLWNNKAKEMTEGWRGCLLSAGLMEFITCSTHERLRGAFPDGVRRHDSHQKHGNRSCRSCLNAAVSLLCKLLRRSRRTETLWTEIKLEEKSSSDMFLFHQSGSSFLWSFRENSNAGIIKKRPDRCQRSPLCLSFYLASFNY